MAKKKVKLLPKGPPAIPSTKTVVVSRTKTPEDLKVLRIQNRQELEYCIHRAMDMSLNELHDRLKDVRASARELHIIQILVKGITSGDFSRFNALLYWVFGKPTETYHLAGSGGGAIQIEAKQTDLEAQFSQLSDKALRTIVAQLEDKRPSDEPTDED